MATDGGISDNAIINETRPRNGVSSGWASLGNALGGGQSQAGGLAYDRGMQIGAQTVDALAQAKDRIQQTQNANAAGDALESPQLQQALGLSPEVGHYAATAARSRVPPQDIATALTNYLSIKQRSQLADPTTSPDVRLGAALALHPEGAIPHAEGTLGTVLAPLSPGYNPNAPVSPTNSPVSVGGPQMALTQSQIDENKAKASEAPSVIAKNNAESNKANMGGPGGVAPFRQKIDPDTLRPVLDSTGRPIYEPTPGGPKDPTAPGMASGREAIYNSRVLQGAEQASTDIHNLTLLPTGTTSGFFGTGSGPGKSLLHTVTDDLRNRVSSDYVQKYNASLAGLSRGLATVESNGLVPSGTFTQSMEAYAARDGDSPSTIMWKQAQMRQVLENGYKTMEANPRVAQGYKDEFARILGDVKKSIPYTPEDVLAFDSAPKGTELGSFLGQRRAAEASASANPPVGQGGGPPATPPAIPGGWSVVSH